MSGAHLQPTPLEIEELTVDTNPASIADARELLLEYGKFVASQPATARFCFGSLEKEAAGLPLSYREQGGGCMLARVSQQAAAFVAWRVLSSQSAGREEDVPANAWELKRLWVRAPFRRIGLARTLTQTVLDRARAAGQCAVYLDTAPAAMPAAYRLYLSMGFVPVAAYNDNPVEELAYLARQL